MQVLLRRSHCVAHVNWCVVQVYTLHIPQQYLHRYCTSEDRSGWDPIWLAAYKVRRLQYQCTGTILNPKWRERSWRGMLNSWVAITLYSVRWHEHIRSTEHHRRSGKRPGRSGIPDGSTSFYLCTAAHNSSTLYERQASCDEDIRRHVHKLTASSCTSRQTRMQRRQAAAVELGIATSSRETP